MSQIFVNYKNNFVFIVVLFYQPNIVRVIICFGYNKIMEYMTIRKVTIKAGK